VQVGATIHVVPGQEGGWYVVDPRKRSFPFPNQTAAVEHAKRMGAKHPPSQVVLFKATGQMIPIARYQLPDYRVLSERGGSASLIEAAVKAQVIGGLVTAGVAVLQDLVENVERELAKKSKSSRRRRASPA
jgi:hypothetical protein